MFAFTAGVLCFHFSFQNFFKNPFSSLKYVLILLGYKGSICSIKPDERSRSKFYSSYSYVCVRRKKKDIVKANVKR